MPTVEMRELGDREITLEDTTRATNNVLLSDYIGKYVAGQISTRYSEGNLQDALNRGISVSVSWG